MNIGQLCRTTLPANLTQTVMLEFFSNSWTVGIGGGIISSLIVFFMTSKIFSRRENKEYQQKVRLANNELLYAIRPLVVEKNMPTIDIINSLLRATSKKYSIQISDLYTKESIADDLTKEVMDNPFLTSESKLQYCCLTEDIKKLGVVHQYNIQPDISIETKSLDSFPKEFFSLTLAAITFLTTIASVLFDSKSQILSPKSYDKYPLIFVTLTVIPVATLAFASYIVFLRKKNVERTQFQKHLAEIQKTKDRVSESSSTQ